MDKQKPKLREILTAAMFIAVLGVFFALNIFVPAPEILEAERRIPAKFPELSVDSVFSGSFMNKFDDYAADRFVFRDAFRTIHSIMVFDLYMQQDVSGLYRNNNIGIGEFKKTDVNAVRQTAQKINNAARSFDDLDVNIYYSLIPDKSIYAGNYMPGFDLALTEEVMSDVLGEYPYIRIADILGASDYYKTDLHWDQTSIRNVADHLLLSMGADPVPDGYRVNSAGSFLGAYAGQIALPVASDTLSYTEIPGISATYLNERTLDIEPGLVYDVESINSVDPYNVFLRGPQPLVILENPDAPERELYLFRDSFGSSLAPLLTGSYSKITIIDLRYIPMMLLDMFVDISPGSDVLFIYSSMILNNPSILQV